MEFGIFTQTYVPGFRQAVDPDAEHHAIQHDIELAKAADKAGFKYVWVTEHHFLHEYSHMSANDTYTGYLACCTDRIHIGSGIFNPLAMVNHPVKVAERVAMLDHLSDGRFEFGTGRGAGSHEIIGFLQQAVELSAGSKDLSITKEIWEETIGEFPKMWMQDTYEGHEGKWWSLPPRKVLPKPWKKPHPAMWYAAGNTTSYAMAARKGLGVLGFSVGNIEELEPVLAAYKKEIVNAEPVGAFVNDNVMVTSAAFVTNDHDSAVRSAVNSRMNYLQSNVFRYHDTFPHPAEVPYWPDLIPDYTEETIEYLSSTGAVVCGDPDEALEQCRRWEAAGCDQLVFGSGMATLEEQLETIRIFGEYIIPKIDTDPVHRTTRFREEAAKRLGL